MLAQDALDIVNQKQLAVMADVTETFLCRLLAGKIAEPSVNKIERLYNAAKAVINDA